MRNDEESLLLVTAVQSMESLRGYKLKDNGIEVILNETKGTMHGFDIKDCDITNEAVKCRVNFIKTVK